MHCMSCLHVLLAKWLDCAASCAGFADTHCLLFARTAVPMSCSNCHKNATTDVCSSYPTVHAFVIPPVSFLALCMVIGFCPFRIGPAMCKLFKLPDQLALYDMSLCATCHLTSSHNECKLFSTRLTFASYMSSAACIQGNHCGSVQVSMRRRCQSSCSNAVWKSWATRIGRTAWPLSKASWIT